MVSDWHSNWGRLSNPLGTLGHSVEDEALLIVGWGRRTLDPSYMHEARRLIRKLGFDVNDLERRDRQFWAGEVLDELRLRALERGISESRVDADIDAAMRLANPQVEVL